MQGTSKKCTLKYLDTSIHFYKPGIRFYKPGIHFYKPGIRFYKPGIHFYKPGIHFYKPGIHFVIEKNMLTTKLLVYYKSVILKTKPWGINYTLIYQYWLVLGRDSRLI